MNIHDIGVWFGARREVGLGCDSPFLKGKDMHLLGIEDLRLINPSLGSGEDISHGEDHGGNLLIYPKRELTDKGKPVLDSSFK